MKNKKRLIIGIAVAALFAAAVILLCLFLPDTSGNGQQSGDGNFTISGETLTVKAGEPAEMKLNLSGNPGVSYIRLTVESDAGLVLEETQNGKILNTLDIGKHLLWSADEDSKENGVLATLRFTVPQDAASGEYPVKLILRECYNAKMENVGCVIEDGKIYVSTKEN